MSKGSKIALIIVVIVVVAGGAYMLLHKSSKPAASSNNKTSTSSNASAAKSAVFVTKTNSTVGQYLADPSGKALYTYNGDASGVSNCTGSCLASWPAYVDKGATTGLPTGVSTIKRTDNGQIQYTYNGMPLYYFVSDKPGQVTGSGVDNFSLAKPAAASSSSSSSSSQPSSSNSSSSSDSSSSSSPNYNY